MISFRGVDYFQVDSLFDEQELLVRRTARQFVDSEVVPVVNEWYRDGTFPAKLIPEMGRLGFLGANLEGYGCAGMSNVEYGLIMQELERGDSGLRSFVSVQGALVMYPIHKFGSEAQKSHWLPLLQSGAAVGCFGLTEPDFGSNPAGMRTTAVRDGAGWVIDGEKTWITNGSVADVAIVWARTAEGIRGFLVERGTPGYTTSDIHGKWSMRASVTSSLAFSGCRVPDSALLPEAKGLKGPLQCLSQARFGIGWGVLGAAMDCYETARQYSIMRKQFDDRPLASHQLVQGETGLDDYRNYQGATTGGTGRTAEGSRQARARAYLDAEAQQRHDCARMRTLEPRLVGRQRHYRGISYNASPVQSGDGENL